MPERFDIEKFIEYKKTVEKERPILTVGSRLITIDGVDGVGKSTIARKVFEKLQKRYGEDTIIMAKDLIGTEQKRLEELIRNKKLVNKKQIDDAYSAMMNRMYKEVVVPALEERKIVIIDRSELDLLRYAIGSGEKDLVERRLKQIQDGTVTHRLWAGNRIFIKASAEDIEHNLSQRMQNWSSDPKSRDEIEERINIEEEAKKTILSTPCEGRVNVIKKENKRQDDLEKQEVYLGKLAEEIIEELNLPNQEK